MDSGVSGAEAYALYFKIMDGFKQAMQRGMSARDYAEEMGVKSSVADVDAGEGLNNKYESGAGAGEILPNVEKVIVDTRKITEYALNPNSTSGGANKARVFESALGYNQSNTNHLIQQIRDKLPTSKAILGLADKYGQRFMVDIPITGPNGKTAIVRTGWILEPGSDIPRMTTAFVR